ncbi:MAG: hypothetical protein ACYDCK_11395 [Thermoplasmatota archaeon]
MKRIVILAAQESAATAFADSLAQGIDAAKFEVKRLSRSDLQILLPELAKANLQLRREKTAPPLVRGFDDAPIVLVDEETDALPENVAFMSGEKLAKSLRALTSAGPTVNVYPRPPYVPTFYLSSPPPTLEAEWKLRREDLAAPSLWGKGAQGGFDPWYAPNFAHLAATYESRIANLVESWENPILSGVLGVSEERLQFFPVEHRLAPEFDMAEDTPAAIAKQCVPEGLAGDSRRAAPIVAAVLTNWIYTTLLPLQTPLVDAPHLAMRFPSLFTGVEPDRLCFKDKSAFGFQPPVLQQYAFESIWIDRAVWMLRDISSDEEIREVREPWSRASPTLVFAEDISGFRPIGDTKRYSSDGAFVTRYVEYSPHAARGFLYEPRRRLVEE